jgi:hypothetical protein
MRYSANAARPCASVIFRHAGFRSQIRDQVRWHVRAASVTMPAAYGWTNHFEPAWEIIRDSSVPPLLTVHILCVNCAKCVPSSDVKLAPSRPTLNF